MCVSEGRAPRFLGAAAGMVGGPFPVLSWQGRAEGLYWGDPGVGCPLHCTRAPAPPPTSQVQSWLCRPRMVTVPHWPVCPRTKHTAGHRKRDYSTGNLGARGDLPTCPSIVLGPREVPGGGWLGEKPACPSGSLFRGGAVWGGPPNSGCVLSWSGAWWQHSKVASHSRRSRWEPVARRKAGGPAGSI